MEGRSLQVFFCSPSSPSGHPLPFQFHHPKMMEPPEPSPGKAPAMLVRLPNLVGTKAKGVLVRCAKGVSSGGELEAGGSRGPQEEEQSWMDALMGEMVRGKCTEGGGVAEVLECLEREAIMGDDNGKLPTDYNRRAQIFDRSSRLFQNPHHHPSSS